MADRRGFVSYLLPKIRFWRGFAPSDKEKQKIYFFAPPCIAKKYIAARITTITTITPMIRPRSGPEVTTGVVPGVVGAGGVTSSSSSPVGAGGVTSPPV